MFVNHKTFALFLVLPLFLCKLFPQESQLNILHYEVNIEPKMADKYIEGELIIQYKLPLDRRSFTLNVGNLKIDSLIGPNVHSFRQEASTLEITLSEYKDGPQSIHIQYHGRPEKGLIFNPDLDQVHSIYFTEEWMPCQMTPKDRASLSLNILVPRGKQCIASGELEGIILKDDKLLYKWKQGYETPAYAFGFVIGSFTEICEEAHGIQLSYYSSNLKEKEVKQVFEETANILKFFEEKSGIPYVQNAYSQIIIGSNFQEMSGLAVFSTSYPSAVFKDSSEIHLTAHELAHQWWGNMITCESFKHFWLNEAMAVYMASAFNEYRFGKEKYRSDIALYKGIYDDLLKRNKDKALVFEPWLANRDNRHVVYYKGAYVLHLLREELGDEFFWEGIQSYSQRYYGKSVQTEDFKSVMEEVSGRDLDIFFEKWVHKRQ